MRPSERDSDPDRVRPRPRPDRRCETGGTGAGSSSSELRAGPGEVRATGSSGITSEKVQLGSTAKRAGGAGKRNPPRGLRNAERGPESGRIQGGSFGEVVEVLQLANKKLLVAKHLSLVA